MFLRKNLEKILLTIAIIGSPLMVYASSDNAMLPLSDSEIICPSFCCDLPCFIKTATNLIFPLTALGLLASLIYAGFLRITAGGNVEKVKKSNQVISASILGFIIIALSGVIVNTMCALLGVQCF